MTLTFHKLHPCFAAEVSAIDLRQAHDARTLAEIRAGMDEYAVLVFRDQPFTDEAQLTFARRRDGELHTKTGARVLVKSRLGNEAVADICNLDEDGGIMKSDTSFQDPPGRYSMLSAKVVPALGADTEFADTRAAYDALEGDMKLRLEGLRVHHSIAHSRQTLGFEFSADEAEALRGAVHPLVHRATPFDDAGTAASSTASPRSTWRAAEKGPSASLAPAAARSTYTEYASRAAAGAASHLDLFAPPALLSVG
jgi:alpha-ketoglutarate-dependent 2,4-dichlorophenoxyacetate dioxygenase